MLVETVFFSPWSTQWPFWETDWLEVPSIYKAYFWGLCKGISPQNMALYGTVPPFQDPEIPIEQPFDNLQVLSSSRQPTDQSLGWWLSDGVCIFVLPFLEFIINLDDESLQFWQLFFREFHAQKRFLSSLFWWVGVFFALIRQRNLGPRSQSSKDTSDGQCVVVLESKFENVSQKGWRGKEVVTVILAEYRGWKSSNVWFTLIQCG